MFTVVIAIYVCLWPDLFSDHAANRRSPAQAKDAKPGQADAGRFQGFFEEGANLCGQNRFAIAAATAWPGFWH